jgi:hypothetical protein
MCRYWSNNGHRSARVLNASVVNDPQRHFATAQHGIAKGSFDQFVCRWRVHRAAPRYRVHAPFAVGLINNPQGASLTLGADLQGLQLPCVTLLPTSPASLKSRTIGSLAQASTALLRAPRLMATGAIAIFMPCRQRFERARDRRSTFSSDILARHCQATKNSRRLSLLAGLRPLHQFGTYPPAPMSHFPENYSRTLEVHSVESQNSIRRRYHRSTKAAR